MPDTDSHQSVKTDLVWIRIEVKILELWRLKMEPWRIFPGAMEAHNGGVEAHNKTMVADSHHFDDELSGSRYAFWGTTSTVITSLQVFNKKEKEVMTNNITTHPPPPHRHREYNHI
jgi:hypothetical protein